MLIEQWFKFTYECAGLACGLLLLFEGTRRIRAGGLHQKAALIASFGAIACLIYVGSVFWFHSVLQTVAHSRATYSVPVAMSDNWGADMAPEKREEYSLVLARALFNESGVFRDYFDRDGLRKRYSPTEKDIKDRDILLASRAQLDLAARVSSRDGVVLLALMLAAIVGGCWGPRTRLQ